MESIAEGDRGCGIQWNFHNELDGIIPIQLLPPVLVELPVSNTLGDPPQSIDRSMTVGLGDRAGSNRNPGRLEGLEEGLGVL